MRTIVLLITCGILLAGPVSAQADEGTRAAYQIKAAYLYNFIKFIDWPEDAFPAVQSPVYIGILGDNPFGSDIEKLETKNVQRHPIRLRFGQKPEDLRGCHLIYIGPSEWESIDRILSQIPRNGTLTVSGAPGFNESGGVIRFVETDNRIKFAINLQVAREANLRISSRLLQLAIQVLE